MHSNKKEDPFLNNLIFCALKRPEVLGIPLTHNQSKVNGPGRISGILANLQGLIKVTAISPEVE